MIRDLYSFLTKRIDKAFDTCDSVFSILDYAVYQPLHGILSHAEGVITCKKGCSYCCSRIVACTRLEALGVVEFMESHPGYDLGEISKSVKIHADMMKEFLNRRSGNQGSDEIWFGKNVPCPFLKDGSCSVYDGRPLSCRIYHSMDPAEKCKDPVRSVGQFKDLLDAEALFQMVISGIARRFERSYGLDGILSISADAVLQSEVYKGTSKN
jgi:Fe-S-cluster containining protein